MTSFVQKGYIKEHKLHFPVNIIEPRQEKTVFGVCDQVRLKKVNRKVQEEATSRSRSQTPTPGGREKSGHRLTCA